jgi:hypothetical protein
MPGLPFIPPTPYAPGPAVHAFAITAGTAFPTTPTRYVFVGTALSAFTVLMTGDTVAVPFGAVNAGTKLEISITEVAVATPVTSGAAVIIAGLF